MRRVASTMKYRAARVLVVLMATLVAFVGVASPNGAIAADYVIHISVDGLRPDAVTALGAAGVPNFYRLRNEGAYTDNARTDYDFTNTLPNHTTQLTGRPVLDRFGANSGHQYVDNSDPDVGTTLATNAGYYVASAFDVAHDHGLSTGLYATKSKFSLYDASYNSTTGAADTTGINNGRDKIDVYVNPAGNSPALVASLVANLSAPATRTNYTFVHFHDPDSAGHSSTWDITEPPVSPYLNSVRAVDGYLGQIFGLISGNPELNGHTTILLSADHGGELGTGGHGNETSPQDYTIPFYAWGAGVSHGDLYAMNLASRANPGTSRPLYSAALQPIRNGDMANLALDLLGLGPVEGSNINLAQNLAVPEPSTMAMLAGGLCILMVWKGRRSRRCSL